MFFFSLSLKGSLRIHTENIYFANVEMVCLWWKKTIDIGWLGHLLFSFLTFDKFSFNMRKKKNLFDLTSIFFFYFNRASKRIVFQHELNALLITYLLTLKSEGGLIKSKVNFFVFLAVP